MPPSSPQSFDPFAADYDRFAGLESPKLMHWVTAHLPPQGRRALDVGCGSGRYSLVLAERFHSVVAIDISEALINLAQQSRPHPRVRYDLCDLMAFDDSAGFDLVFSSATLHHLQDLDQALRRLCSLIAPGGVAILIDNVAPRPTPARWVHVLGAVRAMPADARRLGWNEASWLLKFRTGSSWLDHLASDRYLSREKFEHRYGAAFPGALFYSLGYAHALIWRHQS
jgi:ubiquinone/menaquinone biosynthesis C-methylase UbiE